MTVMMMMLMNRNADAARATFVFPSFLCNMMNPFPNIPYDELSLLLMSAPGKGDERRAIQKKIKIV